MFLKSPKGISIFDTQFMYQFLNSKIYLFPRYKNDFKLKINLAFKQFENFKLMMSEGPTAIEEENDEEVVIIKHVTPVESFRNSQEVSKIDISFPSGI